MGKLRKFIVKNAFKDFLPERTDFEVVSEDVPVLQSGEFLVKAEYISVDPYMRSFASGQHLPYEQFGFQVGKVIDSKNPEYSVGVHVVSHSGWRDYAILNGNPDNIFDIKPYVPQIGDLSLSLAVGALGMPGITAYLGLLEICNPKKGDVVCVTSAAGAVGSLVGQIAKLKGCIVIGFAGSDQKIQTLQELGFDHAINYKTEADIKHKLKSITDGIDCFFDNVGGELAATIIQCMNKQGIVAISGSISTYGQKSSSKELKPPFSVKIKSFKFTQWDWSMQRAALDQMREWVQKDAIKAKETIVNGFEELPDTLIAMLKGDHVGKVVVKV